jgi:hypothetical protein
MYHVEIIFILKDYINVKNVNFKEELQKIREW